MTDAVVEIRKVEKYFEIESPLYRRIWNPLTKNEGIYALRDISFRVESGMVLGVVGPNGAGKTTLLRILADLLEPTQGEVTICGRKLKKSAASMRSKIGYVSSDERSFFWRLTGRQNLNFFARLYGVPDKKATERINNMLDNFSLTDKAKQLFRDYSAGTRKKFALIRALVHQPQVILLDEITNSLDPESNQEVKTLVRKYVSRQKDCVALWSTHRLEEIGEICDMLLELKWGEAEYFGAVHNWFPNKTAPEYFLLHIKNLNGETKDFYRYCASQSSCEKSASNTGCRFVFQNISPEKFSDIVKRAVKDYHAQILFAGPLNPESGK